MTPNLRVRVLSYRGPDASATDRCRYDVLVRQGRRAGWDIDYLDPARPECDVAVLPLKRRHGYAALAGRARLVVGDITDDPFAFPSADYTPLGCMVKWPDFARECRRIARTLTRCVGVVAGSEVQAERLRAFGTRTWVLPDAILDADAAHQAVATGREPLRLSWFGNLESLRGLAAIRDGLERLAERGGFELHLVTAPGTKGRWTGRWPRSAAALAATLAMPSVFRPWAAGTCARELAGTDVLLVPVPPGSPYHRAKPPGRVLTGMALGLPVVASSMPSHDALISDGRTGFIARRIDDWVRIVEDLAREPERRAAVGLAARQAALPAFGEATFATRYLEIIAALAR